MPERSACSAARGAAGSPEASRAPRGSGGAACRDPSLRRDLLEDADEQLADRLALLLRVDHTVESGEEALGGPYVHEVDGELPAKGLLDLRGLARTHQPGVHEDTRQLLADGLVHEGGSDGGVHAPGEGAQHSRAAHLAAHGLHGGLDHRGVRPGGPAPADIEEEPAQQLLAALGVGDLGMELHPVQAASPVLEGGDGSGRSRRGDDKARRGCHDRVAVAHPDLARLGPAVEQRDAVTGPAASAGDDTQRRAAVLARRRARHLPAELQGEQLRSVADAEERDAGGVHGRVEQRCALGVDRSRAAREDDPLRPAGQHLGGAGAVRHDLGVHVSLADATRDQLRGSARRSRRRGHGRTPQGPACWASTEATSGHPHSRWW